MPCTLWYSTTGTVFACDVITPERYAVKHVHIQTGANSWKLLPRDWTNRWKWENSGSILAGAQNGANSVSMRITSVKGEVLECVGISPSLSASSTLECRNANGKKVLSF